MREGKVLASAAHWQVSQEKAFDLVAIQGAEVILLRGKKGVGKNGMAKEKTVGV